MRNKKNRKNIRLCNSNQNMKNEDKHLNTSF